MARSVRELGLNLPQYLDQLLNSGHFVGVGMAETKKSVVQVKNPKTQRYVKIDRSAGKIVSHKRSSGPYKGIPVARKKAAAG